MDPFRSSVEARLPRTRRAAHRAARRGRARDAIDGCGRWLGAGGVLALVMVAAIKVIGAGPAWWVVAPACAVAALAVGIASGAAARWSLLRGARTLDGVHGLQDRLSSAMELAATPGAADAAVVELVAAEAERVAPGVSAARAAPFRVRRAWWGAGAALGAAVLVGAFVPARAGGEAAADPGPTAAEREAAADRVAGAIEQLEQAADQPGGASPEELETLAELERELREEGGDPEAALAESAAALERAADEIEQQRRRDELADRALRDGLASAPLEDDPAGNGGDTAEADQSLNELAEALDRGDLEGARDAARGMLEQAERMSPQEREQLADQLDELARQLDEDRGEDTWPDTPADRPEPRRGPSDDNPASEEPAPSPEEIAEQLEREGMDPASAREAAERAREELDRRAAEQQAREDRERLADGARESAERLREPSPSDPGRPPEQRPGPQGEPEKDAADQTRDTTSEQRPGDTRERGNSGQDADQQTPGERSAPRPDQQGESTPQPRPSEDGSRPDGQQPDQRPPPDAAPEQGRDGQANEQQQPGGGTPQPRPSPAQDPGSDETPGEAQDPGQPRPSDEPAQREPAQGGEPAAREQPGDPTNDGAEPGAQGQPGQTPGARPGVDEMPRRGQGDDSARREGLDEALDDLARRPEDARRRAERARDLREQARDLLGPESRDRERRPEDGEGIGPGDADLLRDPTPGGGAGDRDADPVPLDGTPRPGDTEPADFRRPDQGGAGERVVSEWFDERGLPTEPARRTEAVRQMREAADSARRAIEQQSVPRQYRDLIRRVYDRMERRTGGEGDVPLGRDADAPGDP